MRSFFENPGFVFNALSFLFGLVGVLLGVWALWLALVQLRKTLSAAEGARDAANAAREDVNRIVTIVDVQRLSAICIEIMTLIDAGGSESISRPLHQLRTGLVQFHATVHGRRLGIEFGSVELVAEVEAIQRKLAGVGKRSADSKVLSQCDVLVKTIDAKLHEMVPKAASM